MARSFREFDAGPDLFGKMWRARFVWLQTGIAIRHADTVDVKFFLSDGERTRELVVALPHPALLRLAADQGRPLTDPWCMKLAAQHVRHRVASGEDMETALVTVAEDQLRRYAAELDESLAAK